MDAQIAAQFLGTLIQTAGTIFAIYIAIFIYVLQERNLAALYFGKKHIFLGFALSCLAWSGLIICAMTEFLKLNLTQPFSDNSAFFYTVYFIISFLLLLYNFVLLVTMAKEFPRITYRAKE